MVVVLENRAEAQKVLSTTMTDLKLKYCSINENDKIQKLVAWNVGKTRFHQMSFKVSWYISLLRTITLLLEPPVMSYKQVTLYLLCNMLFNEFNIYFYHLLFRKTYNNKSVLFYLYTNFDFLCILGPVTSTLYFVYV